ncbi:UNVERIFIED_CONTAM: Biotin carboxyl carrier protein of acetyl-CoA carboxylase [Sesamum indicum]
MAYINRMPYVFLQWVYSFLYFLGFYALVPQEFRLHLILHLGRIEVCLMMFFLVTISVSGGFGTSGLKVANLDLGSVRPKFSTLQALHGLRTQKIVQFDGLLLSIRSKNTRIECLSSNSEADQFMMHMNCFIIVTDNGIQKENWKKLSYASKASTNLEDNSEETVSSDALSTLIPNSFEVESLLTVLCDTTSIAEFELKLSGFRLHVTRNLAEQSVPPEAPYLAPVTAHSVAETPHSDDSASSPSLALSKRVPSSGGLQPLLDKAADQGLKILQSPRVGYFRRSRTIKGKRAPPSCKESLVIPDSLMHLSVHFNLILESKDIVKEGQVLCYIEQLGGESPIESDVSGEVVKILREDGDPVGYGDALIAILPSFPGIMKLK